MAVVLALVFAGCSSPEPTDPVPSAQTSMTPNSPVLGGDRAGIAFPGAAVANLTCSNPCAEILATTDFKVLRWTTVFSAENHVVVLEDLAFCLEGTTPCNQGLTDYNGYTRLHVSFDAGKTFGRAIFASEDRLPDSKDPERLDFSGGFGAVMTVLDKGTVILLGQKTRGVTGFTVNDPTMNVAISRDGGKTFGPSTPLDLTSSVVGPTGQLYATTGADLGLFALASRGQMVLACWSRPYGAGTNALTVDRFCSVSIDGGDKWSSPSLVGSDSLLGGSYFLSTSVGPDGLLYVGWPSPSAKPVLYASRDGGQSWEAEPVAGQGGLRAVAAADDGSLAAVLVAGSGKKVSTTVAIRNETGLWKNAWSVSQSGDAGGAWPVQATWQSNALLVSWGGGGKAYNFASQPRDDNWVRAQVGLVGEHGLIAHWEDALDLYSVPFAAFAGELILVTAAYRDGDESQLHLLRLQG